MGASVRSAVVAGILIPSIYTIQEFWAGGGYPGSRVRDRFDPQTGKALWQPNPNFVFDTDDEIVYKLDYNTVHFDGKILTVDHHDTYDYLLVGKDICTDDSGLYQLNPNTLNVKLQETIKLLAPIFDKLQGVKDIAKIQESASIYYYAFLSC